MTEHCVFAAGFLPAEAEVMLRERYIIHDYHNADNPQALLTDVAGAVRCVVGTSHADISADLINSLPCLEQVSIYGMGYEKIDLAPLKERSIKLTNTPGVMIEDVADLGMSLLLATVRRVVAADRFVRAGRCANDSMGFAHSVRGKTLGIAGLGSIGTEVARRAEVFGMKIIYHNRRKRDDVTYLYVDSLQELAAQSDVLMLCAPGGAETLHMVDENILQHLGPEGTLINIGRGSLVDETALVRALQNGTIAAAGLDVFADLAHPSPELYDMENVVLTPHRGSATFESRGAMAELFVANVDAYFAGEPLPSEVVLK